MSATETKLMIMASHMELITDKMSNIMDQFN